MQREHVHVHPDRRLSARFGFGATVALAAAVLAASLWTWGVPLTNDGPAHVLGAWVHLHPERYAGIWEPHTPVTAHGFLETQQLLVPLLGWRDAWRVHVVLMAEAWALGYLAFVVALAPQRRWLGLLGFPLALHPNVYMGFFAFTGASACAWFTLAYWLRAERARAVEHTILAVLLLLTALLHVVPAALCGLILVVVTLARARHARLRAARVLWLVTAGVPAGIIALLASGTDGGASVEPAEGNVAERLWNVGASFPGGPAWRVALAFVLVALGIVGVFRRARAARSESDEQAVSSTSNAPAPVDGGRVEQALALCAIVLVCASWAAPRDFAGWQYAGGRFAPLGVGVLVALAPVFSAVRTRAHGRLDRALAAGTSLLVGVFVLGSLAWSFALHASLRAHNAPALAALDAAASASPAEPGVSSWAMIALDPREGALPMLGHQPLFHLHHLFALERGGFATDAQDRAPTIHPLRVVRAVSGEPLAMVRDDVDAGRQALILRRQLSYAAAHGAVVLAGTEADHETALAAGFAPIARARAPDPNDTNGVLVARFEGCSGKVRIEGITEPVALQVGWWPRRSPVVTVQVPVPLASEDDGAPSVDVPLPKLACGDVWVAPVAPAGARCNAVDGPLRATFSRASDNLIVCALAPR